MKLLPGCALTYVKLLVVRWRCLLAAAIAVAAWGSLAAEAQACGERRQARAAHGKVTPGQRPALVIGDSTMILAAPLLGRAGLQTDAKGCRQFSEGLNIVSARKRAGTLPHLVVMALGANGPVNGRALQRLSRVLGKSRVLALVTPANQPGSQRAIRVFSSAHPDRVLLMDWQHYSQSHRSVFDGDGLHVTQAGAAVYARFVERLAAPVIGPFSLAVHLPRTTGLAKDCGVIRRFGRHLDVKVTSGRDRISCSRARDLARRPPLQGIGGWRWADWSTLPGPWLDVFQRLDRRVLVATLPSAYFKKH